MSESEKKKKAGRRKGGGEASPGETSPATPTGDDRVLLFADSVQQGVGDEEEEQQELETWVTCSVADELFGLPVRQVQEILRVTTLTRVPHAPYPVRGVTNMRGYVLPVVDLRVRLGLEASDPGPRHRIMVISSKGRLIGLLVDAVDQVMQIDRLKMEAAPDDVITDRSYYIRGVYHLPEQLLILLDADRVLEVRSSDDEALEA